jgi:integrase
MAKMAIDSPTKRDKLEVRREPYWHMLQTGGYVGYRRIEGGGTWVARWRDEAGKQHYRALALPPTEPKKTFEAATKAAREWFKEAQVGIFAQATVSEAADSYLKALKLRKGSKAEADARGRIDRCIKPSIGNKALDKLTTAEVEDWLHGLIPDGLSEEETRRTKDSANRNLTTLKALLNHAWRTNKVGSNAAWSKVKAFEKVGESRKVFLNSEQRKRLLENCDGAMRDLVEAGLLTGARYGELRSLLVSDYDKGRRILSIREGKTGARDVSLSDAAARLFDKLRKGKLPGGYLLTRDDGLPWQHSDQDELMREAVKKAKLPNGTVFYTLRHTFIANALTGGVDIHAVAKLCGTSVRMIELHYGKLLHADAREKLNRIAFL